MRYVNNYANAKAQDYGLYEEGGPMPVGAIAAKESFVVSPNGKIGVGPLFLMAKQAAGSSPDTGDWYYTMILPNGAVQDAANIQKFCNDCHTIAGEDDDNLMFLPDEYRVSP
ncbi:MAG: hypothetical protein HOK61_03565 [Alphaproteobacteria bacterium]|jgi:hypothetical protein|nr:hypothetical protein [Alphaproteobacteria bacterium]